MPLTLVLVIALTQGSLAPESGEVHLRNLRQLTFGGQNAEAYFSASGKLLIFQRQGPAEQCDQMYVMGADGSGVRRVSSGRGRTTCGYFFDHDRWIFYSSTEHAGAACPPRPDYSHGYVWALYDYDIYTAGADGSGARRLTTNPGYDAEGTLAPDGKTIVFTSLRDGDLDIYTMRVDGGGLRRRAVLLARRQGYRVPRLPSANGVGLGRVPLLARPAARAPPQDGSLGDERGRDRPTAGDEPARRE